MKFFSYIASVLILLSCGEQTSTMQGEIITIDEDSFHIAEKGVIVNLDTIKYYNTNIISFPLYGDPGSNDPIDSIFYLRHFGENGSFYMKDSSGQLILAGEKDYFPFYHNLLNHHALVYTDKIKGRYKVLSNSSKSERWLELSPADEPFHQMSWDTFLDTIQIDSICILPNELILTAYIDTTFKEKGASIRQNKDEYFQLVNCHGSYLQVVKKTVREYRFTNDPWPNHYQAVEEVSVDTFWMNIIDESGFPVGRFSKTGPADMNSIYGVGLLKGSEHYAGFHKYEDGSYFSDSIIVYDSPDGRSTGSIPLVNDKVIFRNARIYENGEVINRWDTGWDNVWGLTSWEYLRVYDKKKNHLQLYRSKFENRPFWINRSALSSETEYYSFNQYYLHFLDGNEGWTKGYSWCGDSDFLYAEPNIRSAKLYAFPAKGNIFLTGKTKGEWAEVKLKELEHIFGEIYYSGKDYRWHTWKGWIRLTDQHGHANLDEIILGC